MKQKLLFFMILVITGISLRASAPVEQSPLRGSPEKELTREQLLQFNRGGLQFATHHDPSIAAQIAARGIARLLEVILKEMQSTTDLDDWQNLANDFVARLPKALGAPMYIAKYAQPLLTQPFCLGEGEEITLQGYVRDKIAWLEDMNIAADKHLLMDKKARLLKLYKDVNNELEKQNNKLAQLDAIKKQNNSLTDKVASHSGELTWSALKFMVYARKAVAAAGLVATGLFAYWLWNRPAKRCEPGVVYCK